MGKKKVKSAKKPRKFIFEIAIRPSHNANNEFFLLLTIYTFSKYEAKQRAHALAEKETKMCGASYRYTCYQILSAPIGRQYVKQVAIGGNPNEDED